MSFHEATVTAFVRDGDTVRLSVEGETRAEVVVHGVVEILIDGVAADSVEMELPDGEVLSLETGSDHVDLIVIWNDFAKRVSRTRSYRVRGRKVEVR